MGQEERKNKAKLEKTQIQLASNSNEYEATVKTLEETTGRWNKEWKQACDVRDTSQSCQMLMLTAYRNSKIWKKSVWTSQRAASGRMRTLHRRSVSVTMLLANAFASRLRTARWRRTLCTSSRNAELAKKSPILPDLSTSAKKMQAMLAQRWEMTATPSLSSNAL